ncbi:MAG: cytochrome c oxidase subunit II [Candidatus Micrarchaeota archaeon]
MKLLLVLLVAGVLLLAGCGAQAPQGGTAPPSQDGGPSGNGAPPPSGEEVVIDVTAKQFEYSPSTITVKKGDRVRLRLTSEDVTHGFSLPEFGLSATIEPGKTTEVTFTPDKAGTFTFQCNMFCGSGHQGMKGTLIVTE